MKPLFSTFEDFFENLKLTADKQNVDKDAAHQKYISRILSMMQEYDISMSEAIEWDMDGFHDAPGSDEMDYQYDLDYYFWINNISYEDTLIYRDIIAKHMVDLVVKKSDDKQSS